MAICEALSQSATPMWPGVTPNRTAASRPNRIRRRVQPTSLVLVDSVLALRSYEAAEVVPMKSVRTPSTH